VLQFFFSKALQVAKHLNVCTKYLSQPIGWGGTERGWLQLHPARGESKQGEMARGGGGQKINRGGGLGGWGPGSFAMRRRAGRHQRVQPLAGRRNAIGEE
jgi:hypothetical protein